MSSITADGLSAPGASDDIGPLEQKHLQYANYRAVAGGKDVSKTHWHIAIANALGWGFDGMDGVIFALISPLVIKEFALTIPEYRSGLQIALFIGIAGLYFWPWLSDRLGRRTLLAVNIAMFSLLMPVAALSPTFAVFVMARSALFFALNGEWSLGSMLVAETWPARLRGRVITTTRSAWCLGASLAGGITGLVAANFGWRVAVMVPGVIALLAIYVRAKCPESPYWVRAQDRKQRIAETLARGGTVSDDDNAWFSKARSVGIRQVFLPDVLPATLVALFVACCSTCIYGTVGSWMPLYLSTEKHWSTTEYSLFYVFYGICGFIGLCLVGWLIDRIGRRLTFIVTLTRGRDLHDALGLFREPHLALDVRAGLVSRLPRLLGTEHDLDRGGVSDTDPRRRQWRGLGDRLFRRLRAVSLRHGRAATAHRLVRAGVPPHPRADGRDGDRRHADGARAFGQGAERDYCVRIKNGPSIVIASEAKQSIYPLAELIGLLAVRFARSQ